MPRLVQSLFFARLLLLAHAVPLAAAVVEVKDVDAVEEYLNSFQRTAAAVGDLVI